MRLLFPIAGLVLLPGCLGTLMQRDPPAAVVATSAPSRPPRDPSFAHGPDAFEAFVACATQGYAPVDAPQRISLDGDTPPGLALASEHCYRAVVRFGPDAHLSDHALAGLRFVFRDSTHSSSEAIGGPGVWGPGGVATRGCIDQSTIEAFSVEATWGTAYGRAPVNDLGTGSATVQLYERRIDPARQAQCARQRDECNADWRTRPTRAACDGAYEGCVQSVPGVPSAAACRR